VATTVEAGAPLALVALGVIALAVRVAMRRAGGQRVALSATRRALRAPTIARR